MADRTLKLRDVAQIYRMFERLVRLMTCVAAVGLKGTEIDRMFERTRLDVGLRRPLRIVKHGVTNVAIVGDHLARLAYVVSIVTAEAAGEVNVSDIIRMRLPVRFHLGEEVGLVNILDRRDRRSDGVLPARKDIRIIRLIKIHYPAVDGRQRLIIRVVIAAKQSDRFAFEEGE